jgi:predicted TIM-barrel fold metal-dependent hydrolase
MDFAALFDRSDDYAALLDEIRQASDQLTPAAVLNAEAGAQAAQDIRRHCRHRLFCR